MTLLTVGFSKVVHTSKCCRSREVSRRLIGFAVPGSVWDEVMPATITFPEASSATATAALVSPVPPK